MKILALSDLHGNLPDLSEYKADIAVICGDIVPLKYQINHHRSRKWFRNDFSIWSQNLPVDKVYFIAGNHDFLLEAHNGWISLLFPDNDKVTYINQTLHEYNGLRISGTPYCHKFGNWAFMQIDDLLYNKYNELPENLDILITHDVPYGIQDICLQEKEWNDYQHIGNVPLFNYVRDHQPKILCSGHLHSTDHNEYKINNTRCFNCSILDENYNIVYKPQLIEL